MTILTHHRFLFQKQHSCCDRKQRGRRFPHPREPSTVQHVLSNVHLCSMVRRNFLRLSPCAPGRQTRGRDEQLARLELLAQHAAFHLSASSQASPKGVQTRRSVHVSAGGAGTHGQTNGNGFTMHTKRECIVGA